MKILHVITSLSIGGAETLVTDMAIEMRNQHEVTVFVLGGEESFLTTRLREANVAIVKLTNKIRSLQNLRWLQKNMSNYDVVHAHLSWAQYFVSIAARTNKKCQVITTEHNTSNRRQQNVLFKPVDKLMYKPYDKIIVISEGTRQAMIKWQPQFAEKFRLIHNGINTEKFKNAIADQEIKKSDKIKLLMVAAFRHQKDQDTVVRALNLLDNQYELYFVGDGERRSIVEDLVNKLNLNSRVNFLGVRADVAEIMKACDIFILSSHWEGFGLVAVEAMAAGLPVIGTNVDGLREVIDNTDMLFEVGNAKELMNIIRTLNKDEEYYQKCVDKGNHSMNNYDFKTKVQEHLTLYSN